MKYLLINDTHCFGPLENIKYEDLLGTINKSPFPVILNGDVIDLKNTWKKDVLKTKACILELKSHPKVTYIGGNHELNYGDLPNFIGLEAEKVYVDHSDLISNPERYLAFRKQEPGASWFKRHIITPLVDAGRHFIEVRPNDRMLEFVRKLKQENPKLEQCWFGHAHPDKDIVFMCAGVKCTIWSRGMRVVST